MYRGIYYAVIVRLKSEPAKVLSRELLISTLHCKECIYICKCIFYRFTETCIYNSSMKMR